jgi:cell wall assembly regulator SMI1
LNFLSFILPFADGDNGDYLLFDTDPSELGTYGQIILLENETWERVVIANSLEELIKSQIEKVKKENQKIFGISYLKLNPPEYSE